RPELRSHRERSIRERRVRLSTLVELAQVSPVVQEIENVGIECTGPGRVARRFFRRRLRHARSVYWSRSRGSSRSAKLRDTLQKSVYCDGGVLVLPLRARTVQPRRTCGSRRGRGTRSDRAV